MAGLTAKQEAFAIAVFKGSNASDAYRTAYSPKRMSDKTVNEEASRLLANPKISARIAELRERVARKAELTIERTLQEVARLAYFDSRRLYREDGEMKRPDEWDDDTAAAVAAIEVLEEFEGRGEKRKPIGLTKKVKLWDKNSALEKAMKHLGLFEKDNAQQTRESLVLRVEAARPVKKR